MARNMDHKGLKQPQPSPKAPQAETDAMRQAVPIFPILLPTGQLPGEGGLSLDPGQEARLVPSNASLAVLSPSPQSPSGVPPHLKNHQVSLCQLLLLGHNVGAQPALLVRQD